MPDLHATWLSHLRLQLRQRFRHQQQNWLNALPSQCAVCGRWPGPRICHDCRARWVSRFHRCQTCAIPLPALVCTCGACLLQAPKLKRCTAALNYAYPWQDLITSYKFQADLGLARSLGRLLASHPEVKEQLQACDVLLHVPTTSQRIRERGFDHSLLLARALARQSDIKRPVLTQVVQRQHLELAQHASTRAQRLRQLRGVFSLAPAQTKQVAGRHILLIDDVMTTGATLDALASCLLTAGASSVCAVVLARTA